MLGGLAAQLIMHERIRTTETKATRLRPMADRLVTLGKEGSVHARRRALSLIEDREVIHKLFADVAPRFAGRSGGYTRVLKLGPRQGDAAPMAIIEFVEGSVEAAPAAEAEQRRRRGLRRRKPAKPAAEERGQAAAAAPGEPDDTDIEEEPGVMQGSPESGTAGAEGEAEPVDAVREAEEAEGSPAAASSQEPEGAGDEDSSGQSG